MRLVDATKPVTSQRRGSATDVDEKKTPDLAFLTGARASCPPPPGVPAAPRESRSGQAFPFKKLAGDLIGVLRILDDCSTKVPSSWSTPTKWTA